MPSTRSTTKAEEGALWYKDAIIYQTHVRAFCDSDGDGIGDFRGLTEKLDYIQDLGVTAIWLLPFYPSPLRDDGYDIADYTRVNSIYGTLADFKGLLREAHRRGLRVITELVLNHTSDQHAWFQRARRGKADSKARDYYVWSDSPEKYKETRIIFQDFEASNWSWDPVANAYFWHRFYSHQPDLNFDNPDVHASLLQILDFWLKMGVDGLRLDAIPYLYEREGTSCENLPETHGFLKKLRAHVDTKFQDRMLLAEANQWPEDAVAYFGDGDECHMAFHFPLMPRLFMAVQSEDRMPVIDILQQTPAIPETCQWTIFLRNHDELTLEMVTDEERDYMYRVYARDPQARINLGIRRRLAPLLGNNRRKIELMKGLLLSLPGTPVIYYGDELGMGDNIYLGDRDSVRTPMQWSADRNAGFSHANPQKLYLPVVTDPEFHFTAINVETEQDSPHSLLWWTKRLIALRKRYKAFSRGSLEFLTPENTKVLAFLRRHEEDVILVVANLSRFVQSVSLDLTPFRGMVPVELFGRNHMPEIEDRPYPFTLGPHNFFWMSLERVARSVEVRTSPKLPTCRVTDNWLDVFQGRTRSTFVSHIPDFLSRHRWFGAKARTIQAAEVQDVIPLNGNGDVSPRLVLVRILFVEGEPETYQVPLAFATGKVADRMIADSPGSVLCAVESSAGESLGVIYDACRSPEIWTVFQQAIERRKRFKGRGGEIIASYSKAYRRLRGDKYTPLPPTVSKAEQSNSAAVYGERFILKLFRRLDTGVNPDLEISRMLTEKTSLEHVPAFSGAVEYQAGRGEPMTLAILHEFKAGSVQAWEYTLDELGRYFERVSTELAQTELDDSLVPQEPLVDLSKHPTPELAVQSMTPYLGSAELLGRRTAELHLALADLGEQPGFAAEAFTPFYQRGLCQSMRNLGRKVLQLLRKRQGQLPDDATREEARELLAREGEISKRFNLLAEKKITALRIRCHGDYHLGQVLYTGRDFAIIDFEGEPTRSITERRIKRSPLRDVAGMLRSFHYAAHAGFLGNVRGLVIRPEDLHRFEPWANFWCLWTSVAFLRSYLKNTQGASFLPNDLTELKSLLDAYMLEKALYEMDYELNNRPDWARIPIRGVLDLLNNGS